MSTKIGGAGSVQNVLHVAALRGDWKTAEKHGDDVKGPISRNGDTAIHIATLAARKKFVKKLVGRFGSSILGNPNGMGKDALSHAATIGSLDMVKAIVKAGNRSYPSQESRKKALLKAASLGHPDITKYLFKSDELHLNDEETRQLYTYCVEMGLFELATKMSDRSQIRLAPHEEVEALRVLARTPSAFSDESQSSGLFSRFVCLCGKFISRGNSAHSDNALQIVKAHWKFDQETQIFNTEEAKKLLFIAAEEGNVDFIIKLIELDPNLLWTADDKKGSILHVAVQHRQEKIFSLFLELGGIKEVLAKLKSGNGTKSLLHLVAELPPDREKLNTVCGAALQFHRELVWFKEVEKIIPAAYKDMKNSDGMTAQTLFTESHKDLRQEGEKWMKETAQLSAIVATLIAGVMFAAAFSVPGGFDGTSGQPSVIKNNLFVFFSISEAIGLFSSSASILMFLSILTSHYAQNDFLKLVPFKLLIGFTSLFVSITAMIVAFSIAFALYHNKVALLIALILSCVPFIYIFLTYRGASSLLQPKRMLIQ